MKKRKNNLKLTYPLRTNMIRNHQSKNPKNQPAEPEITREQRLKQLEEIFQQGKKEYLNLFRECPEALVYTNIDGIILHVNHYFELLTGYPEENLKGNSLIYCLKPEDRSYFETNNREYFETVISREDHSRIEVLVMRSFNQTENRLAGMIFSFRDISIRKKERKVTQTLYRISQITHSGISIQEMYPLVHQQLGEIIDATNFYVALLGLEQGQLHFPYYTDEAAGQDEIFINRYCTSQSIFHYILKVGKPVLMDYQRYRKMLSYGYIEPWDVMTNTHLWLGIPLKVNDQVIGVIALQSYDNARLYSEKDLGLLEFVSQQLAGAIYHKNIEVQLERFYQNQDKEDISETGNGSILETKQSVPVEDQENE